jgi:hypothetical protein
MCDYRRGFELVTGFIDHFVTTNNTNTIAISTLYNCLSTQSYDLSLLLDVSR